MQEIATPLQLLFDIVLWLAVVLLLWPAYNPPHTITKTKRRIGYLLLLLFCLFPFWGGDYFHYKDEFYDVLNGGYPHVEPVYQWVMFNLSFESYLLFRLIIWGGALLLLLKAYSRSSSNFDECILLFAACYLPLFSYARVSLSISLIILGLSFVVSDRGYRSIVSVFFGLTIIGCSEFFHRSAIIGIAAAIASLFLMNAKKGTIFLVIIILPLAVYLIGFALQYISDLDLDNDMFVSSQLINTYLDSTKRGTIGGGLGEVLMILLARIPLYLSAILYLKLVINGSYSSFTIAERVLSSFAFCCILLGALFLIDFGFNTNVFHYRTLNLALPANAVFLAAVYKHNFNRVFCGVVLWTTVIGVLYSLSYSLYCAI